MRIVAESRLHNQQGTKLLHGLNTAAFAEVAIVDQSQLIRIPAELPMDRAALLSCGVITGVGAAINAAQIHPGANVVVIGTGGVGLNAVQGAVLAGASQVIALDILDHKLTTAVTFGATSTINTTTNDARQAVRDLTAGRGADYVLVTVGNASGYFARIIVAAFGWHRCHRRSTSTRRSSSRSTPMISSLRDSVCWEASWDRRV